jgi:hypothetical protein
MRARYRAITVNHALKDAAFAISCSNAAPTGSGAKQAARARASAA